MITTTLERIYAHSPRNKIWDKLLLGLGKTKEDSEPLPFSVIVNIVGLKAAIWCCQVEPQYGKEWRFFAVWCARQVQHLLVDQRSIFALDVAEAHANGLATDDELLVSHAAAYNATQDSARDMTRSAAQDAASDAAWDTTWASAEDAAWVASCDAAWAMAEHKAEHMTWDDAEAEALDAQKQEFLRIVG